MAEEEKDGEAKDHDGGGGVGHQRSGGGGGGGGGGQEDSGAEKTGNVANSAGAQIRNGTEGILSGGKDDHSL